METSFRLESHFVGGVRLLGEFERLSRSARAQLSAEAPSLLDTYPIRSYLDALKTDQRPGQYEYLPPENQSSCRDIEKRYGRRVLEAYQKLLLLTSMDDARNRVEYGVLPPSIRELLRAYFEGILFRLGQDRIGFYLPENDAFCKELAVARLRLLPCGPELVDGLAGVPRSVLYRGGVRQFVQALMFFGTRTAGFFPFYELHMDRELMGEFSEEGYDRAYLRIAELLERNSAAKGLSGRSWFYDPCLEDISPELVFLRKRPQERGALLFYDGPDEQSVRDALKFSTERTKLHEEGKYKPVNWWLIWPRRDLLAWAEKKSQKSL